MSTNTNMPTPACENCGRDKTPTYICDACIDKLNAATRAITAERDEWKRKYDEVNENYMGLVNLFLPYLQAAQERAIAEGKS